MEEEHAVEEETAVRLTVVSSQPEADIICSLLRANDIKCGDRAADTAGLGGLGFVGAREILVEEHELERARELLASTTPAE